MASLETIAFSLVSKALELSNLLREHNLPQPSFNERSAGDFQDLNERVTPESAKLIHQARNSLIDSANDLALLAKGPTDSLLGLTWASADSSNLANIVRFNIPDLVPIGGTKSMSELATLTRLPEDILARSIRYAIRNGVFREPKEGIVAHSALSARLVDGGHLRNIVLFSVQELGCWMVQQSETLEQQIEKGDKAPHAALNLCHPQYEDAFDFFHKETAANNRYHRYLEGRTNTSRWAVSSFVASWDWTKIGSGVLVDCGGSIGHSCAALAPICPGASFIVQDMNMDALKMGRNMVAADKTLLNRVNYVEHDFFTPQKTVADAYLFRHILHDWNDEDSVKIIKALVPALRNGARVLIAEGILPAPPMVRSSTLDSKNVQIEDLIMMAAHNAKERTASQFEAIFKKASPNFHMVGVTGGGEGSFQSIVEFMWLDDYTSAENLPIDGVNHTNGVVNGRANGEVLLEA